MHRLSATSPPRFAGKIERLPETLQSLQAQLPLEPPQWFPPGDNNPDAIVLNAREIGPSPAMKTSMELAAQTLKRLLAQGRSFFNLPDDLPPGIELESQHKKGPGNDTLWWRETITPPLAEPIETTVKVSLSERLFRLVSVRVKDGNYFVKSRLQLQNIRNEGRPVWQFDVDTQAELPETKAERVKLRDLSPEDMRPLRLRRSFLLDTATNQLQTPGVIDISGPWNQKTS